MAKVTILDVASASGVSAMTVSRVLNDKGSIRPETRERVEAAIARLGYRPSKVARSLITNKTQTLGMVVPDIGNPFFPEIVAGAEEAAWQSGYSLVLCNTNENPSREKSVLDMLEDARVDGVILASSRLSDDLLHPYLLQHSRVVLVNRYSTAPNVGTVCVEDAHGTMRAVHHLLGTGKKTIAFIAGPENSRSAQARRKGFVTAFETSGRTLRSELIVPSQPLEGAGYTATKALLAATPEIDALLCYNDLVAIGALQALRELGRRVPEDVAVVGCDNIRLASLMTPSLTTLGVDKRYLGEAAVTMLLRLIGGELNDRHITVKPELIIRESA
jgi:LacI family transcriptional regulator